MKNIMRGFRVLLLIFCVSTVGLTACGEKTENPTQETLKTSVSFNKDGSISSKIVEDFGESYYDVAGLKSMIEAAISEYQKKDAAAQITLKSCEASDNVVKAQMEFDSYKAYAGFNEESFFAGTVQEANMAGFNLDVTLKAVSDKLEKSSVSKPDILGMGDKHIIIVEAPEADDDKAESLRVKCFDEILYVGDGVTAVDKKNADVSSTGGYGIIIFK